MARNGERPASCYTSLSPETYVLAEAAITAFSFARLFKERVKEVITANTCGLKHIGLARCSTDKRDADKLCLIIKMRVLCGEQPVSPVALAPGRIRVPHGLFAGCRLLQKQNIRLKNRIHSLVKEQGYGFTQQEICTRKSREMIRSLEPGTALHFPINRLPDLLEQGEEEEEVFKERVLLQAAPHRDTVRHERHERVHSDSRYHGR